MDRLSPEMLHMVCTFLKTNDICNFRLVNKTFAVFGEGYLLPDLTFFLHKEELRRLREIADHKILAKNVRSLTYSCDLLDAQDRQHLESFAWSYAATHCAGRIRDLYDGIHLKKYVMDLFRAYEADMEAQENIIGTGLDVTCLREVLPKFTTVQRIAVHANLTTADSVKDSVIAYPPLAPSSPRRNGNGKKHAIEELGAHFMDHLHPLGCRQLESILAGLTDAHTANLQTFYAGSLSWRFFDRDPEELARLWAPLRKVRHLELVIEAAFDLEYSLRDSIQQCRQILGSRRGFPLRQALKQMKYLTKLKISFAHPRSGEVDSPTFAADLADILDSETTWFDLRVLHLQGIDTDQHFLVDTLRRHHIKLEALSLEDFGLRETSWRSLLPEIKRNTHLHDFSLSGTLLGRSEEYIAIRPSPNHRRGLEYWVLPTEEDEYADSSMLVLKDAIGEYCRFGGTNHTGDCPLSKAIAIPLAVSMTVEMMSSPIDIPPTRHWIGKEILV